MPFNLTTGAALRRRINALDPERDDEEITRLSSLVLYGDAYFAHSTFLVTFARQAAVPAIARVLYRSGQGDVVVDPRRRNDDTIVFFTEFYRRGYRSEQGRAAIARMEKIHSNFKMDDETKAYTMATVIFEPERLAAYFGCAPFSDNELMGRWNFWRGFAAEMPLKLPADTREDFLAWMTDYEQRAYAYTPDGAAIFDALVEDWRRWYPNWIGGAKVARESLLALLDGHLRNAFHLPRASRSMDLRAKLTSNVYLRSTPIRVMRRDRSVARRFGRRHADPQNLDDVGYTPRIHQPRDKAKPAA
ncbi:MAG: DUF2236 domain-containing protein [Actinobacteria bacterium]|nr:DUF2236 domain-containing protein [Actinomycetota bacterium]